MRLWHKDLIKFLPRLQIVSQHRELQSIFVNENRHILINFVYEYPYEHLKAYSELVKKEMYSRGYKISDKSLLQEKQFFEKHNVKDVVSYEGLYAEKMDDIYYKICLYNLLEKRMCDGIPDNEWRLEEIIKERIYNEQTI